MKQTYNTISRLVRTGALAAGVLRNALSSASASRARTTSLLLDGRRVLVWHPSGVEGPLPLVLFSHGYGGANLQSASLMGALASEGFLVIAPNHRDAARWAGGVGKAEPQGSFGHPEAWNDETYRDRAEDILACFRALPAHPTLSRLYNGGPVILIGHSLGGYTMMGLAGARTGWKNEIPVAAVVALSPYLGPFLVDGSLRRFAVPVMYQGGTLDLGITPYVARPGGAYDQTPSPKCFVSFDKAGHLAWTELQSGQHAAIRHYLIAFCGQYGREKGIAGLEKRLEGVAELRMEL